MITWKNQKNYSELKLHAQSVNMPIRTLVVAIIVQTMTATLVDTE